MGANTAIEWTDATWSPLSVRVRMDAALIAATKGYTSLIQIGEKMAGRVGQHCEPVSDGCKNCYSGTWQRRCLKSGGTGLPFDRRSRDLIEPFVDEKALVQALRWRMPKKIFVENQSDLFGDWYTDEMIDRVFAVMALCPQHVFQVLTKRPERMLAYIASKVHKPDSLSTFKSLAEALYAINMADPGLARRGGADPLRIGYDIQMGDSAKWWPLVNVWLGVSVEDEPTAARMGYLLQTPAAKRFVSYEPALAPVDFAYYLSMTCRKWLPVWNPSACDGESCPGRKIDWIIVGGESGPGARPFDIQRARNTIAQCEAARVPCFVKQLGARPGYHRVDGWRDMDLKDGKGGEMSEWPEDLRVREFPA